MITCTLLSSTSCCVLVFAPAGLPPVSAIMSSTFLPAIVLLRSLRKSWIPSSIWRPPAARAPVRTVRNPIRIGSVCACANSEDALAATIPSAIVPMLNHLRDIGPPCTELQCLDKLVWNKEPPTALPQPCGTQRSSIIGARNNRFSDARLTHSRVGTFW